MDADYVKEKPYIYLSVKGDDMFFQITACFITDIDFDYIAPNPTGEELTNFFEQVAKKNWLEFDGVSFGEEDTVLTLSTCCRKYDEYNTGNQRLVLMAKLLPEGAIAQELHRAPYSRTGDALKRPKRNTISPEKDPSGVRLQAVRRS